MKFGSSGFGSTALEYPVVPAFSPEIHEYTLYFPDDMKGIYGLVTSVFPGKVMAYFKDCKGNDESVCLNAYEKYGQLCGYGLCSGLWPGMEIQYEFIHIREQRTIIYM